MGIEAFYDTEFGLKTLRTKMEDNNSAVSPVVIANGSSATIAFGANDKVIDFMCDDEVTELKFETVIDSVVQNGSISRTKASGSDRTIFETFYLEGIDEIKITNVSGPGVVNLAFKIHAKT